MILTQKVKIGEIGDIKTGKTPPTNDINNYGNDYMFIGPTDLHKHYIIDDSEKMISEKGLNSIKGSVLNGLSILVGCIGWDMGNVALVKGTCTTNQQINSITNIKSSYNPYYIYYWLKNNKQLLFQLANVTRTPILNKTDFSNIEIEVPSKSRQNEVVKILNSIDTKIALNNRINAELEAMAKTVYDYWFVQFDFPNAEGKHYKSNGGKMVWSEELKREIPEGWEVSKMKKVIKELECGDRPKGGVNSIHEGIPSIGAENILRIGEYDYSKEKYIPEEYFHKMNQGQIKSGDVLMYKDGASLGRVSMFKNGFPHIKCAINSHAFIVRTNSFLSQNYLYFWLDQQWIKNIIISLGIKAAQPGINQINVNNLPILIPEKKILAQFENALESSINMIFENSKQNQQLSSLRDWLLPMLMNGQVVSTSLNNREEEVEVEGLMAAEPGVEYKSKNTQLDYYHKIESVYVILWANKLLGVQQGEMALAKDTYLVDKLAGIDTGFTFAQHNWGSYDPTFKKTINNKQYFERRYFENSKATYFDLNDNEKLLTRIPETTKEAVRKTVEELHSKVFYKYQWSKKAEMKELYATVLKCIEDTQSIDMTVIRQAMKDWKTPKQDFPNKAAKFSEQLTKEALDMIVKEGWDLKVMTD